MKITEIQLRTLVKEFILSEGWLDDLNSVLFKDPDIGKEFKEIQIKAKSGKLSAAELAKAGIKGGRAKAKKLLQGGKKN